MKNVLGKTRGPSVLRQVFDVVYLVIMERGKET